MVQAEKYLEKFKRDKIFWCGEEGFYKNLKKYKKQYIRNIWWRAIPAFIYFGGSFLIWFIKKDLFFLIFYLGLSLPLIAVVLVQLLRYPAFKRKCFEWEAEYTDYLKMWGDKEQNL